MVKTFFFCLTSEQLPNVWFSVSMKLVAIDRKFPPWKKKLPKDLLLKQINDKAYHYEYDWHKLKVFRLWFGSTHLVGENIVLWSPQIWICCVDTCNSFNFSYHRTLDSIIFYLVCFVFQKYPSVEVKYV